jgi:hypothetical protein
LIAAALYGNIGIKVIYNNLLMEWFNAVRAFFFVSYFKLRQQLSGAYSRLLALPPPFPSEELLLISL